MAAEVFALGSGWVHSCEHVWQPCGHTLLHLEARSITLPCLALEILPRKVIQVSSAGPEAQGSSTHPKLFFLCPHLLTCCSDVRMCICSLSDVPWTPRSHLSSLTPFLMRPGVPGRAAGEATLEEGYRKAGLIARTRLALLLRRVIRKIICWTSETKKTCHFLALGVKLDW